MTMPSNPRAKRRGPIARKLVIIAGIVTILYLIVFQVPWYVVRPTCNIQWLRAETGWREPPEWLDTHWFWGTRIRGTLSEPFADHISGVLDFFDVPNVRIGRTVLVRYHEIWSPNSDYGDGLLNGINKYIRVGFESDPIWASMPDNLKRRLLDLTQHPRAYAYFVPLHDHCDLVRAVTMEDWGGARQ